MLFFQVVDLPCARSAGSASWSRSITFASCRSSATCSSATSPTTSCRPGSASWCGATTSGDREGISRTTTLGTVVVERVVDTVVVVVLASLAILVLHVRGLVARRSWSAWRSPGCWWSRWWSAWPPIVCPGADRVIACAERWPRIREMAAKLRGGLAVAGRPRTLVETLDPQLRRLGRDGGRVRGRRPVARRGADDRPGGAARGRRGSGLGNSGRAKQPRHLRPGGRRDRRNLRDRPRDGACARPHRPCLESSLRRRSVAERRWSGWAGAAGRRRDSRRISKPRLRRPGLR